jgi:MFS family permease
MLLLGRGFQGLGFSGLAVVTRLILSDKVSLRENAKNNSLFNLLNGIAMGVGPVIGGYLTKVRFISWPCKDSANIIRHLGVGASSSMYPLRLSVTSQYSSFCGTSSSKRNPTGG